MVTAHLTRQKNMHLYATPRPNNIIAKPGCYTTHEHNKHTSGCFQEPLSSTLTEAAYVVCAYLSQRDRYLLWRRAVRSVRSSLSTVRGATERRAPILRYIRLSHTASRKQRHSSLTFFPFTILTMTVHFTDVTSPTFPCFYLVPSADHHAPHSKRCSHVQLFCRERSVRSSYDSQQNSELQRSSRGMEGRSSSPHFASERTALVDHAGDQLCTPPSTSLSGLCLIFPVCVPYMMTCGATCQLIEGVRIRTEVPRNGPPPQQVAHDQNVPVERPEYSSPSTQKSGVERNPRPVIFSKISLYHPLSSSLLYNGYRAANSLIIKVDKTCS
jgi:hypothetical protein